MDVGLVIGLVLVLAVLICGTLVTVRAVARGVERTGAHMRRSVEETALKARSVQPGPVGEAARIRLELRASIDSTRAALEAGVREDAGLADSLHLLDRLHDHARQLDGELRLLMEHEPDRARLSADLPEARERMRRIKESADSLRFAAQDRARRFDAEGLAALRDQIDIESGALRHWTPGPASAASTDSGGAGDRTRSSSSSPSASSASEDAGSDRRALGPSEQGLDPSLTDPTADPAADSRRRSRHPFEKRSPRSAS